MKRLYDLGGIITFILLCAFVFGGKAVVDKVKEEPKQEQGEE